MRTLPLSLAGIFCGTALAMLAHSYDPIVFIVALLTTVCLQITSNFANDYGDGTKGTDSDDRVGPKRAIQSGALSPKELLSGIITVSALSFCLVLYLVYLAFGASNLVYIVFFLLLGVFAIWAALKYTMGKTPYGYQGLGDFFVFVFFGLVAVLGTKFLFLKMLDYQDVLPAITMGLLSVGVLNLNNLRDVVSDEKHGKNTLVVKMGFKNGKRYHFTLLLLSFLSFLAFLMLVREIKLFVLLVFFAPIAMHLFKVSKTKIPAELDPELKKLALSTFGLALSFYLAVNYFL